MRENRRNKKGSTMIETLVAFLVVVLMVAMFSRVAMVAARMLISTQTIINKTEQFNENYYKLKSDGKYDRTGVGISSFSLSIDREKTSDNNGKDNDINLVLNDKMDMQYYLDIETNFIMYSFEILSDN